MGIMKYMNRPAIIALVVVIVFGTAIAAAIVFFSEKESPITTRPGHPFPPGDSLQILAEPMSAKAGLRTAETESKPKKEAVIGVFGTTVQIPTFVADSLKPLVQSVFSLEKKTGGGGTPVSAVISPIPTATLTEKEIFEAVWPQNYRDYLQDVRSLMIEDGFIQPNQYSLFVTDQIIYEFVKKMDAYALSKGWITEEDYKRFLRGIDEVLPKLIEEEKNDLRTGRTSLKIIPGGQYITRAEDQRRVLRDLLEGFIYVLTQAHPVYAGWVTSGDCYKDDDPGNKQKGSNSSSFCCNCGLYCAQTCVFIEDCGPDGSSCNRQLGCLNKICPNKSNAIWDQESGICGCDG